MFTLQNKSIAALIIACTLTICSTAMAYDAWPSNFQWIYPQTLNKNSEFKFSWQFHISPSYYSFCEYKVEIYFSENRTLSSNDHLFYDSDTEVPPGVIGFTETTTVRPGSQGWSSLPETGTYYVFLKISPGWNAPFDTNTSNNNDMAVNPIQVIGDKLEEPPSKPINPSPSNGSTEQPLNIVLSWSDGGGATSYDVYFGIERWPSTTEYKGNQTSTVFDPGILYYGTTYYWRIDSKNAQGTTRGEVWSFSTIDSSTERTIIYVDDDAIGSNDGSSWIDAYNYLQDALIEASSTSENIEILVAQGIYKPDRNSFIPNGNGDRQTSFQLIDGVSLQGGYAGWSETNPNERDVIVYETILSGDLNSNDIDVNNPGDLDSPSRAENSYYVVIGSGTDTTAVLDGFTIEGGNAKGSPTDGGGMFNLHGNPTVTNCIFSDNIGDSFGGGMYNRYSNPTITDCTFIKNFSDWGGGGMYNTYSDPTIINCTFIGNLADSSGGGMYNVGSDPIITNCIFSKNLADYEGGGMCNSSQSGPTLINCTFNGNYADRKGGGIYNSLGSFLNLTNCMFSKNTAVKDGGGIYNDRNSNLILTNCTFAQNSAENGNAFCCDSYEQKYPGNVELINCILWDGGNEIWNNDNSTINITYSCIQDGFPGEGNIDTDPLFIDPGKGNFRLSYDSPCIDAGIMVPGLPDTDIEGNPRPNPPGSNPDMGAYENGIQLKASNPIPADGAAIGQEIPVLSWIPGIGAIEHDVYFGKDLIAVTNSDTSDTSGIYKGRWIDASYTTEKLYIGTTYYWRIDEINDLDPDSPCKGDVWSFTVISEETIEQAISSSEDDGYATGSSLQNLDAGYLKVGSSSFGEYSAGMVFRNLNIPQGAVIISAHLKIRSYNTHLTDIVLGKIAAEATDNAAAFGGYRNINSLNKTTAAVDWDLEEPWPADTWYTSPDIADVVQEVVNRSGWSADNSLAILYSTRQPDGGYRNFSSFDRGNDYAPKLEITYVP